MAIEQVQAFYQRLSSDQAFSSQIQNANTKEECSKIVKAAGYDFTQQEFEDYTAQILESDPSESELQDLNDQQLEAIVGGISSIPSRFRFFLMYGVVKPRKIS